MTRDTGLAYVYCDYKASSDQTLMTLIASLCAQLLEQRLPLSEEDFSTLAHHKQQKTRPNVGQLSKILRSTVATFKSVYIIIDAIDEYTESLDSRQELISTILEWGNPVRLLCTSRPLLSIKHILANFIELEIQAIDSDVQTFLTAQIERGTRLRRHVQADPSLNDGILRTITSQSGGM